jgi:hypothetical protein
MQSGQRPNFRAIGRLVEQRRLNAGLAPGELARRAKLGDIPSVGGCLIRAFELWGRGDLLTIVRVLDALAIDDDSVMEAGGLDLQAMRHRWQEWATASVPITMSVRLMPAVWHDERVPDGLDNCGILEWAQRHPRWKYCLRCIRWTRTHCTYIRADGSSYERIATFPEGCPEPSMTLR